MRVRIRSFEQRARSLRERIEPLIRAIFEFKLKSRNVCEALDRRGVKNNDLPFRDRGEPWLQSLQDDLKLVLCAVTLRPRLELDEEQRAICARADKIFAARLKDVGDLRVRTN